ncbi:hypothetical protein JWG39_04105 [Desulforhopalus vacuolatus]|uniref:hypothetical protein n=1 Tax=Desulforhopalus vacuolatus TaxID=40414 RepID=UPI001964ED05|nr:hypothetical protein [Desulforhopalus vacuolatus]MBM9518998.1 hypothetical protein [Desulforhopalus vacuolatus]
MKAKTQVKSSLSTEYHVQSRVQNSPESTALKPTKAESPQGSANENISVVVERILNKDSSMLKKGTVQPVGTNKFSAWQMTCDEGGLSYEQSSPNPLSYLTTGITSNLLTQLQRGIEILNLDIDSLKVEVKVFFRFHAPMSTQWAGFTDKVIANILIESKEPAEKISELKELALRSWVAGAALAHKTDIEPELVINGHHWDNKGSMNGSVPDDVSVDNNLTLTAKGSMLEPETIEVGKDVGIGPTSLFKKDIRFAVVATAESAHDSQSPCLQKIKVRAIQKNYTPWVLYADDSYGYDGLDKAPSSLDYLTAGTAFCLASQLDLNFNFFRIINKSFSKHQIEDYRVEQQINYRMENFMTPEMAGYADKVITKIVLKGHVSEENSNKFFNQSLQMCFAGEAFKDEIEIVSTIYLNGEIQ